MKRNALGWLLTAGGIAACGGTTEFPTSGGGGNSSAGSAQAAGGSSTGETSAGTGGVHAGNGAGAGSAGTVAEMNPRGGRTGEGGGSPSDAGRAAHSGGGFDNVAGNAEGGDAGDLGSSAGARAGEGGAPGNSDAGESGDAGHGGSPGSDCVVRVAETGSDSNTGADWTLAVASVQQGMDVASELIGVSLCPEVDVWVAAGTYRPSFVSDPADLRTATFQLRPGVHLYGGFAGTESVRSDRDVVAHVSVLSGDIGALGVDSDNSYHVVTGADGATLAGFTVTGGYANGAAPDNVGAGMYNETCSPVVIGCTFQGNTAAGGAGMFNRYSWPLVANCTFADNSVQFGNGAGMSNDSSSPLVTGSRFTNNSAQYSGGAMSNENGSSPELRQCAFTDNDASETGGAIVNLQSWPVFTDVTFTGNHAYSGGAMANHSSNSSLTRATFERNSAYQGGSISNYASQLGLTASLLVDNAVSGNAKYTGDPFATGGAIHTEYGSYVVLTGCTVAGNSATYAGGALYTVDSEVSVFNSILWGDTAGESASELVTAGSASPATVSHSIVQDGYPGTAVGDSDPLFMDAANGDFRLSAGSPAVDAGESCSPFVAQEDRVGRDRWDIAGIANVSLGFDIGAFEYPGTAGIDTPVDTAYCP